MTFILASPSLGFDRDRLKTERLEVIRTRAHVDFANVTRELEAVCNQFGWGERREFERPLVQIHVGMKAAPLLELRGVVSRGLELIQRTRRRREKAKRIEMRAADGGRFHDPCEFVGRV